MPYKYRIKHALKTYCIPWRILCNLSGKELN